MQNAKCRMQNEIIRLSSNSQIQTTIVEKSGWRPLISFGSTFPSAIKTFPKQMFALVKDPFSNFPFRKTKEGSTVFVLPVEGSVNNFSGKFLGVIGDFFQKVP